jgi:hypothetical protein
MLFDLSMRIWIAVATLVCNQCRIAEYHRMTQSMLSDKLRYGHTCQQCIDGMLAGH